MKMKNKRNIVVLGLLAVLGCSLLYSVPSYALTRAENERFGELLNQGYSPEEANEIVNKEFGIVVNPNPTLSAPSDNSKTENPETTPAPAHVHTWAIDSSVDATCTQEGTITRVCSGCGAKNTENTPKTDHTYELTESVEANCQQKAVETYTCSVCGDTYTVEGELGDHIYTRSSDSVPATCEQAGTNVYVCSLCGDTYSEEVPALGHEFSRTKEISQDPTCTEVGKKAYICVRCGLTKDEEIVPATGHTIVHQILEVPTFWHKGRVSDYCVNCKQVLAEYKTARTMPWLFTVVIAGVSAATVTAVVVVVARKKKQK